MYRGYKKKQNEQMDYAHKKQLERRVENEKDKQARSATSCQGIRKKYSPKSRNKRCNSQKKYFRLSNLSKGKNNRISEVSAEENTSDAKITYPKLSFLGNELMPKKSTFPSERPSKGEDTIQFHLA